MQIEIDGKDFVFEFVRGGHASIVRHMFTLEGAETFDVTQCVEVDTDEFGLVKVMDGDRLGVLFHSGNDDE